VVPPEVLVTLHRSPEVTRTEPVPVH
jgi:hypothetical protein